MGAEHSWESPKLGMGAQLLGTGRITHIHKLQRCQSGCLCPTAPLHTDISRWRLPHLCSSSLKVLRTQNRAGQGLDFLKYFPKPCSFPSLLSPAGWWVVCSLALGLAMGGLELKARDCLGRGWCRAGCWGGGPCWTPAQGQGGSFLLQQAAKSRSGSNWEAWPLCLG